MANTRPDRKGAPPTEVAEAERMLEQTIENTRKIVRRYPVLYRMGYEAMRAGSNGGGAKNGHRDEAGRLAGTQSVRELLMDASKLFGRALSASSGALKAIDKIEEMLDEAHTLEPDREDRQRERTVEQKEFYDTLRTQMRKIAQQWGNAERIAGRPLFGRMTQFLDQLHTKIERGDLDLSALQKIVNVLPDVDPDALAAAIKDAPRIQRKTPSRPAPLPRTRQPMTSGWSHARAGRV